MNHLFSIILLAATATTAMADISMGESRRRPAPKAPAAPAPAAPTPAEQQSITWETVRAHKGQLLELLRGVTDTQSAAQAQGQLLRLSSTIAAEQQQLAGSNSATDYRHDPAAVQLEAQLQQEIARVAGIAGGAFAQKAGLQQALFRYIPETGYDTSGAHDVGGSPREPERPQRTAPPLRPMPRI